MTEDVRPLSRRAVRAQLVVGLGGLPVLGDPVRDQGDRWPVLDFPGIWLALDIRSDAGVQVASLGVENWLPQVVPSSDQVPRSVPVDIPWTIAREIGQASAATRRLRVFPCPRVLGAGGATQRHLPRRATPDRPPPGGESPTGRAHPESSFQGRTALAPNASICRAADGSLRLPGRDLICRASAGSMSRAIPRP